VVTKLGAGQPAPSVSVKQTDEGRGNFRIIRRGNIDRDRTPALVDDDIGKW